MIHESENEVGSENQSKTNIALGGSWKLKFFVESGLGLLRSFPGSFCAKHLKNISKNIFFQQEYKKISYFGFF